MCSDHTGAENAWSNNKQWQRASSGCRGMMQRSSEPLKMPQQATVQICLSLMSPYMPSFPRIQSELLLTHYTPWPYSLIQALSLNSYDALFSTLTSCLRSTYSYAISYFHLGPTNLNASSKLNSSPPYTRLLGDVFPVMRPLQSRHIRSQVNVFSYLQQSSPQFLVIRPAKTHLQFSCFSNETTASTGVMAYITHQKHPKPSTVPPN